MFLAKQGYSQRNAVTGFVPDWLTDLLSNGNKPLDHHEP
jgi:hypothetical protein